MTTRVIAFDIDGALTDDEGIEKFKEEKLVGNYAGIISARSPEGIREFVESNRINPCFSESAIFKGIKLRQLKRTTDADEYIYYGSWARDRLHANLSGWRYKRL